VPSLCQELQQEIKDALEQIGGLQVKEVTVLVDDFNSGSK